MIKHIVMWKLKDRAEGASKEENALKFRDMLEALRGTIPQIQELEVGFQMEPSGTAYDMILVITFRAREDLEQYQIHPEHQKVVKFVQKITDARAAVDYEAK